MTTRIEIIAIGNELTSGRILNTTSGYAAKTLFAAGYEIDAMNTIGDQPRRIGEALQRAIKRADVILVTGGLGCTDDDLTTEAVASALNLPKTLHTEILKSLVVQSGNKEIPPQLEKLAWLPQGAIAFDPARQMSGYQLIYREKPIFFLPGIPEQAKVLLNEEVLPALENRILAKRLHTHQRLYRLFGLEENNINSIVSSLAIGENVQIGYYPHFPEVHLNIVVRCTAPEQAKQQLDKTCSLIESAFGEYIFAHERQSMAGVVGERLLQRKLTLAVAESCTGGLISQQITATAGSSAFFLGGVVSYANSMKMELLAVRSEDLITVGAVSKEVAEQMAQGIRRRSGADFALSVTGIAGPGGGSKEKPVGTVYIGLSGEESTEIQQFLFSGNREQIRQQTAMSALNMLRIRL